MHCSWLNARNLGCKEAGFDDKNLTLRFGVRLFDEEVLDREIQSGLKNYTGERIDIAGTENGYLNGEEIFLDQDAKDYYKE